MRAFSGPIHKARRKLTVVLVAAVLAPAASLAQPEPSASDAPITRAPAAPALVPAPDVVAVLVGGWLAPLPDGRGGTAEWRLDLADDGKFTMRLTGDDGQASERSGSYEVDSRSVRLIYPASADESDPNSTALNLSDARSLETYFYRLLGPDRLAFRPTLCRVDPCQWIADRVE